MFRQIALLGLTTLLVAPGTTQAQDRRERERERAEPQVWTFSTNSRPRLGVSVSIRPNQETDRYGARIESVIPDGPADKAGLKAGDIITRFNGTSLAGGSDQGNTPGERLIELAGKLDEGDTARLEYRRDGASHTATVVAELVEPFMTMRGLMPQMREFRSPEGMFRVMPDGNFNFSFSRGMGLDLVEMNSQLGEYFGTSEGLLVTRPPADSALPLRAGDVVLSIDGRKPSSVGHAQRILGSYEDGETARIEILRKRQRTTVEYKVERPEPSKIRRAAPLELERTRRM